MSDTVRISALYDQDMGGGRICSMRCASVIGLVIRSG